MDKNKEFDLKLNSWGPYNKDYLGVCHIADRELGATFNVELFPGFFRRKILISHSCSDNGLKMWGANASLTRFCYRYELEWRDAVYCDADFIITDDKRCDITCRFVNNTEVPQSVNMNLCASLQYPAIKNSREFVGYRIPKEVTVPSGARLIDAVDYDSISCGESLSTDGRYLGEEFVRDASGKCTALSGRYFYKSEHFARYTLPSGGEAILLRYKAPCDTELLLILNGEEKRVFLKSSQKFTTLTVNIGKYDTGAVLELRPTGNPITLDALAVGAEASGVRFMASRKSTEPKRELSEDGMTLSYRGIKPKYTIRWQTPIQLLRRYYTDDIEKMLTLCMHDHVSEVVKSESSVGVYESLLSEPIFLEPGGAAEMHFTVYSDEAADVRSTPELYKPISNPEGEKYLFSQNMMAYNTFLNVVYPIYTRRQYIRHNTPGRFWDCLYSWDSGFIGMGLATADFDRAFDCLYTYLTPVGDPHSPYIFHGSVVPTQIFLYQYLFNKYPEKRGELRKIYPMIKGMFDFYGKMDERADQMKSSLLKTWNIFYNSGGWDDYPAQKYLHSGASGEASTENTTPVITTALTVLIAKILCDISSELEIGDSEDYEPVIKKYKNALLTHAWNEDSGYFSYVVHNSDGTPRCFLNHESGADYNMGFDGIYPFIAGISTPEQSSRIFDNIKRGLMTPVGLSAVDTRAPYFRCDGYWNGSVWMPHQWILWRSLLDRGLGDFAFEIAKTALDVWQREVDESYSCFEHFMITNGRGSGFHQFSGLSTPVLMFFESYYRPGTVTLGFLSNITGESWNGDKTSLTLKCIAGGDCPIAIICLQAGKNYTFIQNGKEIHAKRITDGAYEISLPIGESETIIK